MLPDYLVAGLRVVIVGTAAGDASAARGHYYAGRGNQFWKLLRTSGLVLLPLRLDDDGSLPSFGIGLTDRPVARRRAAEALRGTRVRCQGRPARASLGRVQRG
jgi:mismatch-specific thymine-DNA glycosylase